jgi:hypothetical protein
MNKERAKILKSWDFEAEEETLPDKTPCWLNEFDKNVEFRKAVAMLYESGWREGYEFAQTLRYRKEGVKEPRARLMTVPRL